MEMDRDCTVQLELRKELVTVGAVRTMSTRKSQSDRQTDRVLIGTEWFSAVHSYLHSLG